MSTSFAPLLRRCAPRLLPFVAAGLLLGSLRLAAQQPPRLLSYQGVLADAQRLAVIDGSYTLTFRIYGSATGGTPLWEEVSTVTTVSGVFDAVLGLTAPINLKFDRPYWLATQLQGEPEMTPRVQLVAAPYAMQSHEAQTALSLDASAPAVVHTLNSLDGNLVLIGEGMAHIRTNGDTLSVVVPSALPTAVRDGQIVRWNGVTNQWEAADPTGTVFSSRFSGSGNASSPIDLAQQGATAGQSLTWNAATGAWTPGEAQVTTKAPLQGVGTAASPIAIQNGSADGQVLTWDAAINSWKSATHTVQTTNEIAGNGTTSSPLQLAQQGALAGQVLRWDSVAQGWRPGPPLNLTTPPLTGNGTVSDPLRFANGTGIGQILFWDGTKWKVSAPRTPQDGEALRWNAGTNTWEPTSVVVTGAMPLSIGSLWYGGSSGRATELAVGTPNQVLTVRADGSGPEWSSSLTVDTIAATTLRTTGDAMVGGGLTVFGAPVTLPNGSIDNSELANSSIKLAYGNGVGGDDSVQLGGTLNLRNTGVLSITGTPNRISADTARGNVTLNLPQDIHTNARPTFDGLTLNSLAPTSPSDTLLVSRGGLVESRTVGSIASLLNTTVNYGSGISGDATIAPGGTLNLRNTGVLTVNGTTNRISVDTVRGNVTLNLPQDIHTTARPTFDGLTLNSLTKTSTSDTLITLLGGVVQARPVSSLAATFNTVFWTTTGNSGTTPGTNYIGTNDAQAFQIHVDNANAAASNGRGRVMRFEPNATSANIIGGHSSNSVTSGVVGATISGGGANGASNAVSSNYGTISGGNANIISTSSTNTTIAGGTGNQILASAGNSSIGGGFQNIINASASTSVIGGGASNQILGSANGSVISGGSSNRVNASATVSVIAGGNNNVTNSTTTVLGGGDNAVIGTNSRWSVIAGGHNNAIGDNAFESSIGAGEGNGVGAGSVRGTVGGGSFNKIGANAGNSTIGAGYGNTIRDNADRSTLSGGMSNTIDLGASISTIGGGFQNIVDTSANTGVIAGGSNNKINKSATLGVIGGGDGNQIAASTSRGTIAGGYRNYVAAQGATVAGGETDSVSASQGAIGGGTLNKIATGASQSVIGGGNSNSISTSSAQATIGGGNSNTIGTSATASTIAGGMQNNIGNSATYATIAGGRGMTLNGARSFGFLGNNASGTSNMTIAATDVAVFGNTDLWLANNDNSPSQMRFYEAFNTSGAFPSTANYSSFQAQTQTADINYILPDTAGIAGDFLSVKSVSGTNVTLDWASVGGGNWTLTGNTGTTPGTNYIGTNDAQAFEIHVDNANAAASNGRGRVMRYEPTATSPNIIGGHSSNSVTSGATGATISGGGTNGNSNLIAASLGTIGGGADNEIYGTSGMIGGGQHNVINTSTDAVIAGGNTNTIGNTSHNSAIGGGLSNTIMASSQTSVIAGGDGNQILGTSSNSVVSGGSTNTISSGAGNSVIGGGSRNYIVAQGATIAGGQYDTVSSSATESAIGGGYQNSIGASATHSTIGGGYQNNIGANATYAAIPGGRGMRLNGARSFGFLGNNASGTSNMTIAATDVAVFGNTDLWLANNDNSPSQMRFYEAFNTSGAFPSTANYSSFQAQTQTADINYVLPDTAGIAGDVLSVKSVSGTTVTLDWAASGGGSTDWSITGNTGTTPGTNYIGTNDAQAFEIHVDNANASGTNGRGRVMRFEPNATSANIIGGFSGNSVSAGVTTATIAGGGINGGTNSIASNTGTIGGGSGNSIGASSINATISGGRSNQVGASAGNGTVGGGLGNVITSGDHTTIGGGFNNRINSGSFGVTISGGTNNSVSSHTSRISGGNGNSIGTSAQFSGIGGGNSNTIGNSSFESVIVGGTIDSIESSAPYSTIGGGTSNAIRSSATRSVISGGYDNEIGSSADRSTIGGGEQNVINSGAYRSVIDGGYQNSIGTNARWGVIGGGEQNYINALSSVIAGGTHDTIDASAQNSFIGGGDQNAVRSSAQFSNIMGGRYNYVAASATFSVIGGGELNQSQAADGVVGGGRSNIVAGARSAIPGGRGLTLSGTGSFGFLGANTGANDMSVTTNDVAVFGNTDLWLANNNSGASQIRFYEANATTGAFPGATNYSSFEAAAQTADINYILPATAGVAGDQMTISAVAGTTVTLGWAAPSDRRIKSEIITLGGEDILTRFRGLPLGSWRYTSDMSGRRHYGIMAQDFKRLFGYDGVGQIGTDTTVNDLDLIGVSYLAIQGLEQRTTADRSDIDEMKAMMRDMKREIEELREENRQLRERIR